MYTYTLKKGYREALILLQPHKIVSRTVMLFGRGGKLDSWHTIWIG